MDWDKVYCMDCLEGLQQVENIDLVVADPPYVISRQSNFHTMKDRKNQRTGTMLATWDLEFDNSAWISLVGERLKPGGALIVFNAWSRATIIEETCVKAGLIYKDTLVWHKTNPMPRNRDRRYAPNVEMIQWYTKPGKWTFNRQHKSYESCVLSYPSESGGGFKRYHPTQKPVRLIEYLITLHSNEDDLVVDPFMGSGTTAVACKNLGRHFIGFEVDNEYYKVCCDRVSQVLQPLVPELSTQTAVSCETGQPPSDDQEVLPSL